VPTLKILFSLSTTLTRNKLARLSPASRMFSSGCLNYLRRPLVHEFSTNCAMAKHASLFRPPFLTKKKKVNHLDVSWWPVVWGNCVPSCEHVRVRLSFHFKKID